MSHEEAWTWQITNYAAQAPADKGLSWVRCSVENQSGVEVWLTADPTPEGGVGDAPLTLTARTGSRPDYGPFFCELGPVKAGHYTLTVESLDILAPLWLDGVASAAVAFTPVTGPARAATAKLAHALLLGQLMTSRANFLALTRYVARFGAAVTFNPEEAAQAEHVVLIGSAQLLSEETELRVRQAGARVERAQGNIAELLDRAVAAGTPFVS